MVSSRWNLLAALTLASAGLIGFTASAEEQATEVAEPVLVRTRTVAQDGEVVPLELELKPRFAYVLDEGADAASPYWIGVQLEPPTDILKAHLNLEGGMVAVHVFEGSPAEKGGLKANDIILKAGDSYVKEPGDLLKSVGSAKENELTLVLIRGGKEQTIKVVPTKRPQEVNPQAIREVETQEKEAVRNLEAALNVYRRRTAAVAGEEPAVDVLRLRPGVVAGSSAAHLALPKDVSVTITKEGSSPAKIVVKKDGKEYEATEDKLEKLPEDVLGYVQMVRSGGQAFAYAARLADPRAAPPTAAKSSPRYRTVVLPTPLPPAKADAAKVYRYHVEAKQVGAEEDSKLDRILKIVSQQEDSSVAELRKEVQQLRKELAELRQEKK
jgi:hypothetical protein